MRFVVDTAGHFIIDRPRPFQCKTKTNRRLRREYPKHFDFLGKATRNRRDRLCSFDICFLARDDKVEINLTRLSQRIGPAGTNYPSRKGGSDDLLPVAGAFVGDHLKPLPSPLPRNGLVSNERKEHALRNRPLSRCLLDMGEREDRPPSLPSRVEFVPTAASCYLRARDRQNPNGNLYSDHHQRRRE